jgi:DNA polymerase III epsilon subunit-like protein
MMIEKPLIFFDSEFTSLNPHEGEILSIGMVKANGEEFYIELECAAAPSEWVKEHILPTLTGEKVSREEARRRIAAFVGDGEPVMVAHVNQYDTLYFYKLYDGPETPFFWMPLDFASILYARGYDPDEIGPGSKLYADLGIDDAQYHQHHALDDARLLRETFMKLLPEHAG